MILLFEANGLLHHTPTLCDDFLIELLGGVGSLVIRFDDRRGVVEVEKVLIPVADVSVGLPSEVD